MCMRFDDKIGLNSINETLVIKENRHKTGIKQRKIHKKQGKNTKKGKKNKKIRKNTKK